MGSSMVPSNGNPPVGTVQGNWMWDGQRWVCCVDPDDICPPSPSPVQVTPAFFPPPVFSGPTSQPPWYPGANGGVSFGQTSPPNPVRGHFFFDGKTLFIFDGALFVPVGGAGSGGAVVTVTQPSNPVLGQLWWNGTALQVWDGMKWVNIVTGTSGGGGGGSGAGTVVISTTPPANPVAGMQWWNGSILQVFDGAQWHSIGPGMAAGPVPTTTIAFTMTVTSDKAIGTGWTVVPFSDTPQVDTMQAYDPITHRYKPTKAGMYQFQIRGFPGGGIACVKNDTGSFAGSAGSDIIVAIGTEQTNEWMQSSGISLMNGSTDYVRMWARSPGGNFPNATANPVFTAIQLP